MGPPHGVVVVGLRPTQFVNAGHQEFGRLYAGQAVESKHLVECAVQRTFSRCAVVPDDIEHKRVVEDSQLLQQVEQATNVVIDVLQKSCIDFHLPA